MSLRNKVIRLAHANPELREHLLPLVTGKTSGNERNANRHLKNQLQQKVLGVARKLGAEIKEVDVLVQEEGTVGFEWKIYAVLVKDGLQAQIIYEYFIGGSLEVRINGRSVYKKEKQTSRQQNWEEDVVMVLEKYGF